MTAFHHADTGQPEERWLAEGRWNETTRLEIDAGSGVRTFLLLAAHPDDETLGAGGLLRACAMAKIPTQVVIATDGEASHPDSSTHTPADLARSRRAEVTSAVRLLAPAASVSYLGLPDGELATHTARLAEVIAAHVGDIGVGAIVAAPWRLDGHTDHDTLGAVAAAVAQQTGALLVEYPIWAWHWGDPGDLPWPDLRILPLDDETIAAKRQALATHVTQVAPLSPAPGDEVLLAPPMLAHFDRSFETFIDSAGLTQQGIFERLHSTTADPWQVRESDYELRKRNLMMSLLPPGQFARAYEPGCSIGELSATLAPRCGELICQDLSATAVEQARARLREHPNATVVRGTIPADWPAGDFDLIALSEVGYFLSSAQLTSVLQRVRMTLRPGGYVVLCHWAHPIDGWELNGPEVHARAADQLDLPLYARHADADALLEVFGPCRGSSS